MLPSRYVVYDVDRWIEDCLLETVSLLSREGPRRFLDSLGLPFALTSDSLCMNRNFAEYDVGTDIGSEEFISGVQLAIIYAWV